MIKISGLSHKRENQSNPRLAWFMFHKIYRTYSDINNKEERNYTMMLTSMSEHDNQSGARYLTLPKLMGNASCHP